MELDKSKIISCVLDRILHSHRYRIDLRKLVSPIPTSQVMGAST